MPNQSHDHDHDVAEHADRWAALRDLEDWLEGPMIVLSFIWLGLLVLELTRGLSRPVELAGSVIWVIFIADFALRFALAPEKRAYLARNWLTALSLALPGLRLLRASRVFRALSPARAVGGLRLLRMVGSLNRGMRALGRSFARRGMGYVLALTLLVTLAGAAGMYAFERNVAASPLTTYSAALWWTAMVMTTMGSDYFPHSPEGRTLCVLLALFAFAVFGYVTATLATFFVGRDAATADAEIAGQQSVDALAAEIRALRAEVRTLAGRGGDDATAP